MMATLDVLQRAAAAKRNFVVTHESTFFSHQDRTDNIAQDPTYLAKLEFIQHNHANERDGVDKGKLCDNRRPERLETTEEYRSSEQRHFVEPET